MSLGTRCMYEKPLMIGALTFFLRLEYFQLRGLWRISVSDATISGSLLLNYKS